MGLNQDSQPATGAKDPLLGLYLGNFRVVEQIAEGGMGQIYRAVHASIGRQAAIKVLGEQYSNDRKMVKRLHREARAVNRIGHPNIVDVFDFGRTPDGREYLVMEYLPGRSLAELVDAGRIGWPIARQILGQLLDALAAAHDLGIVHRDVKPENIIIVPKDGDAVLAKVLDFGIAKSVGLGPEAENLTRAGSVMGTPEYIAPEQIRGRAVDGRADIYSVGVVVYEMVMGRRPYEAENILDVLMAHLRSPIPSIDVATDELGAPPQLPNVIRKALAKRPEDRIQDARTFARMLDLEVTEVVGREGTAALPGMMWESATGEEEDLAAGSDGDHNELPMAGATGPTVGAMTAPGAMVHTDLVDACAHHARWWPRRWVLLVSLLTVTGALAAIAYRQGWIGRNEEASPKGAVASMAVQPKRERPAPFPNVGDLRKVLTKARRVLRRGVQEGEAELRRVAARGLGALRDEDAKALLLSVLKEDPERTVRSGAALALSKLGGPDVVDALQAARQRSGPMMQVSIDEALMRLGRTSGQQGLRKALSADDPGVRFSAALALAEGWDRRALPVLLRIIASAGSTEQHAVMAAVGTAARLGHEQATQSLVDGLAPERDPLVRLASAEALARLGDERGMECLRDLLHRGALTTQLLAARVLASHGDFRGLEMLLEGVRASSSETRMLAAAGLGAVAGRSVIPPLASLLDAPELAVQVSAAAALAEVFSRMPSQLIRQSQRWVFAVLERDDWALRHAAVEATSELRPELAVELLGWALRDPDPRVRSAAADRLGSMSEESERAVAMLAGALRDKSPQVRAQAAVSLGRIGDAPARAALRQRIGDDDSPLVTLAAAGQLLASGDTSQAGVVLRALRAGKAEERLKAVEALSQWNSDKARSHLRVALKDRDAKVRLGAAMALVKRGDKRGLKRLRRALQRDPRGKPDLIRTLAQHGQLSRTELAGLAKHGEMSVRRAALKVVAEVLEPSQALGILQAGARDSAPGVRREAARGLVQLSAGRQAEQLEPILRILSRDSDPVVRMLASLGMAKMEAASVRTGEEPGASAFGDSAAVKPVSGAPPPMAAEDGGNKRERPSKAGSRAMELSETQRLARYKFHMSRAEALVNRGSYKGALRHLRRAQRSLNRPPVLCDYGRVHLALARHAVATDEQSASIHLAKAKAYFRQYLKREPRGPLAHVAKGGLRDVQRLARAGK